MATTPPPAGTYGLVIITKGHSFDLAAFGTGDGQTDTCAAWAATMALASAAVKQAGGAEVRVQSGEWYFASTPAPVPSGVEVIGPGAGMAELVLQDGSTNAYGVVLGSQNPAVVTTFAPAAPMTVGTATLSVPPGTAGSIAAGQYVLLMAAAPYGSFLTLIEEVVGSNDTGCTLTLADYWPYTYPAAGATATVYAALAKDIAFADLGIRVRPLASNNGVPVTLAYPLLATGVAGATVHGVELFDSAYYGAMGYQARDVQFSGVRAERCPAPFVLQWCSASGARNVQAWRSQFGVVATGCPELRLSDFLMEGDWAGWGAPNPNLANYGRGFKLEQGCHHAVVSQGIIDGHANANRLIDSAYVTVDGLQVLNHGFHGPNGGAVEHALQIDGALSVGANIHALTACNVTASALAIAGTDGQFGVDVDTAHVITGLVAAKVNQAAGGVGIRLGTSGTALVGGSLRDYAPGGWGIYAHARTRGTGIVGYSIRNGGTGTAIHTADSAGGNTTRTGNSTLGEYCNLAGTDV